MSVKTMAPGCARTIFHSAGIKRGMREPPPARNSSQSSTAQVTPTAASGRTISRCPRSPVMMATTSAMDELEADGEEVHGIA